MLENFIKAVPNAAKLKAVEFVMEQFEAGVFKRIDENRELLEALQHCCPEFLAKNPFVIGWLKSNDEFFTELVKATETENPQEWNNENSPELRKFPRPWPEEIELHHCKPRIDTPVTQPMNKKEETYKVFRNDLEGNKTLCQEEVNGYLRACELVEGSQQWEAILAGVPFKIDDSVVRFERIA